MMQKKKILMESVISQRSYFIPSLTTFSILIKIILKSREHVILLLVISGNAFFSKYQSYRYKGLVPLFDTGLNGIKVADP